MYLEPSAGDGSFLKQLPAGRRLGLDIAPGAPEIVQADFLTWSPDGTSQTIVTIGNPPFGRNCNLAVAFLNHAGAFSTHVAMILPASFQKASVQNRLDPYLHLVAELALPNEEFLLEGSPHYFNAVFQIWERRDTKRDKVVLSAEHEDFVVLKSHVGADIAIRRVGSRAGSVIDINDAKLKGIGLSPNSNIFLKAVRVTAQHLRKTFQQLDFSQELARCVKIASVSLKEMIAKYAAFIRHKSRVATQRMIEKERNPKATSAFFGPGAKMRKVLHRVCSALTAIAICLKLQKQAQAEQRTTGPTFASKQNWFSRYPTDVHVQAASGSRSPRGPPTLRSLQQQG